MNEKAQQVFQILCKAVETDQLKLPTLPEVALKIRQAVDRDRHSAADIAALLSQDSALCARLLQLANSPLYRARSQIDNIHMAITRLGVRIVKDLVVMLAIKQAFKPHNRALDTQFRNIWQTSIDVAAASRVLAKTQAHLDIEQAVLAGLIHNIGVLPIIELTDRQPALIPDTEYLSEISLLIQGTVGEKILSFWNLPQSLIEVVGQWQNFLRQPADPVNYVDIVQAAILYTGHAPPDTSDDWSCFPVLNRLGLDPSLHSFTEPMLLEFETTRSSLMTI